MLGVRIDFSCCNDWNGEANHPFGPAWRIAWSDEDGYPWVHEFSFARKRDAEAALSALEAAGVTYRDFLLMPEGDGPWEHDRIMLEAMQW